ncbi:class I SAM-dependent methyltransferase [Maridesulfovibrio salexigens]|uniref:class I SAM-dependent methyltransferase n=1 Tax=Maridesulfovibrio salexigens TaxID=880 RepID=UPI0005A2EFF1|nr:class I SAM-dependent methyltransferase [Maridesulfovibrio salexigens]
MKDDVKLVRSRWGFYHFSPMPDEMELAEYYESKYYQQGVGSYEIEYSTEELEWNHLRWWCLAELAMKLAPHARSFFDAGCGEGGLLNEFYSRGLKIKGADFSDAGIKKMFPELLEYFTKGNLFESMYEEFHSGTYDIIACANVLEHVIDPETFLQTVYAGLDDNGLFVVTTPNDFSELHEKLLKEKIVTSKWWLAYPDHLSYFNKGNMIRFLEDHGFTVCAVMADNPIDLNLLNPRMNYIDNPELGREAHMLRVKTDMFLAGVDRQLFLELCQVYGKMGVGRNLTYYCKKNN